MKINKMFYNRETHSIFQESSLNLGSKQLKTASRTPQNWPDSLEFSFPKHLYNSKDYWNHSDKSIPIEDYQKIQAS